MPTKMSMPLDSFISPSEWISLWEKKSDWLLMVPLLATGADWKVAMLKWKLLSR